jgi:hypothetical protein
MPGGFAARSIFSRHDCMSGMPVFNARAPGTKTIRLIKTPESVAPRRSGRAAARMIRARTGAIWNRVLDAFMKLSFGLFSRFR